jgi:mannan endo-1,4-beta-mannosidase
MISKQNLLAILLMLLSFPVLSQQEIKPVSPNAMPEAKALLQFIYSMSGKYTLTGQHNFPAGKDHNSQFAASYYGKTPVIWSIDFGFSKAGDKDSYLMRAANVKEAIRQYKMGALVTFCWHAVPPTASEPITFQPLPGADPNALASVQGRLTDQQFKDILTPGTVLNKQWAAQVDTIAHYLKLLQAAHVPVLWRPYHEMNGNWFWWGNRVGEYGTAALYRQIFDRMVNYHKLNNLIWVWSVDRPTKAGMEFSNFYPGKDYVDILALDVYGSDFKQYYYDGLLALSQGKPITLGEVGSPPSPDVMDKQPRWSYWIIWSGMVRNTSKKQYEAIMNDSRVLGQDDPAYINAMNPYRQSLELPALSLIKPADFTGEWVLNEDKSTLGNGGAANQPHKMKIVQDDTAISNQKTFIEEWTTDRVTDEKLMLNGQESRSEFFGAPRITTAALSAHRDALLIKSHVTFNRAGQTSQLNTTETWSLQNHGRELLVTQTTISAQGERKLILMYDRE